MVEHAIQSLYDQALNAFAEGSLRSAKSSLKKLQKLAPDDPRTIEVQGDLARLEGDVEIARKHYEHLVQMQDHPAARTRGLLSLGYLESEADQFEAAVPYFEQSADFLREQEDQNQLPPVLLSLAGIYRDLGRFTDSANTFEELIQLLDAADDPDDEDESLRSVTASAVHSLGDVQRMMGQVDAALNTFRDAELRYQALEEPENYAALIDSMGILEQTRGNYTAAEPYHLRALEMNKEYGDTDGMAQNHSNLAMLGINREDWEFALKHARSAQQIFRRISDTNGIAHSWLVLGMIDSERGELTSALNSLKKAEALYAECGDAEDQVCVASQLGVVYRRQGQLELASQLAEQVLQLAEEMQHGQGVCAAYEELGEVRRLQGQLAEARECWERSRDAYEQLGDQVAVQRVLEKLASLAAPAGE
jgi:tetratricopeptide (TPR) repeat protein